jgi:hypothetical protein
MLELDGASFDTSLAATGASGSVHSAGQAVPIPNKILSFGGSNFHFAITGATANYFDLWLDFIDGMLDHPVNPTKSQKYSCSQNSCVTSVWIFQWQIAFDFPI